jgi:hypothetical protein
MKRNLGLTAVILPLLFLFVFSGNSYGMKNKDFSIQEKFLKMKGDFKIIGEITLKPGEEKEFITYSYKPVTIDFRTSLLASNFSKCKNDGIGIKKGSNPKYYLKDPLGASLDLLPEDGVVKVKVKNFENFPITVKLYNMDVKRT